MTSVDQTTRLLTRIVEGDGEAAERLVPVVYEELRRLARAHFRSQPAEHTLEPTALVHEVFIKLIDQTAVVYRDRTHFLAVAATAMRQVLIDHARSRGTRKRGGSWKRVLFEPACDDGEFGRLDLLALDEALTRLAGLDPRQARVVELRFFGGLSVKESADVLAVSARTIDFDWKMARAWLSRELSGSGGP